VLDAPIWQLLRDADPTVATGDLKTRLKDAVRTNLGERAADPVPAA
jgi:hypothetical protein